jgi:sterol carrier protein 2
VSKAGVTADDVTACELHDCFSANEMITIDVLDLCPPGKAHEMVRSGNIAYGGKVITNPSGGVISKGHSSGATGIAQCAERVWQLRGWANNRLVANTRVALQHKLGLGGAAVVTVYKRTDRHFNGVVDDEEIGKVNKLGYNPAVVANGFTHEQAQSARSKTKSSTWALGDTGTKIESRF